MTEAFRRAVSNPFEIYDTKPLVPQPPAGEFAIRDVTNTTTGATIAGGFFVLHDLLSPPFTPWYDTVLLLHACDGILELDHDGAKRRLEVGGIVWIRAGSTVVFHAQGGTATLFYAVTPADWQFRAPAPFASQ